METVLVELVHKNTTIRQQVHIRTRSCWQTWTWCVFFANLERTDSVREWHQIRVLVSHRNSFESVHDHKSRRLVCFIKNLLVHQEDPILISSSIINPKMSRATTMLRTEASLELWATRPRSSGPRSMAIPIKKLSPKFSQASTRGDSSDCSTDRRYELATWQMYNRIIDYRQRNPLSNERYNHPRCESAMSDSGDSTTPEQVSAFFEPYSYDVAQRPHQHPMLRTQFDTEAQEYGEIFDLEL